MKDVIKWVADNKTLVEILLMRTVLIVIWAQVFAAVMLYLYKHAKHEKEENIADSPVIISSSEYLRLRTKENRYNVVIAVCATITLFVAILILII